jgi:hypothetical protein
MSQSRVAVAEARGQFGNPEKEGVRRWKPLPEEWWRHSGMRRLMWSVTCAEQCQYNPLTKKLWVRLTQQFFFSSSDVIATTCFDHRIIIRRHTPQVVITYPAHSYCSPANRLRQDTTVCHLMMIVWSKHVVAITSEEEKKNCCVRRTHNCFVNYTHATGSNTTVTKMRESHGNHNSWLLIQLTV